MKSFDLNVARLADTAADSVINHAAEEAALASHLLALEEQFAALQRNGADARRQADLKLQMARTFVGLSRGDEAWPLARAAFDVFVTDEEFESAADCCEVLYRADQPDSLAALGQGIWLGVTYPIDPELTIELLAHVIDDTPDDADGAAVAATTALFIADIRTDGTQHQNLTFFASQMLTNVARRHSGVDSQAAFDHWRDRLELREPEKFLTRLRNVVDVLVQDNWWFDRDALHERLPLEQAAGF